MNYPHHKAAATLPLLRGAEQAGERFAANDLGAAMLEKSRPVAFLPMKGTQSMFTSPRMSKRSPAPALGGTTDRTRTPPQSALAPQPQRHGSRVFTELILLAAR